MSPPALRAALGLVSLLCGSLIAAALPLAIALQSDRAQAPVWAALLALLGLVAGCSIYTLASRRLDTLLAEQKTENLRFHTAINNISQGLCFFDGQHRLVVCNNRYADLYKLPRELIKPGTTLAEIVDYRNTAGNFADMTSAEYLAWRETIASADKPSDTVLHLKDGRTVAIHHEPMPDGGWVATHDDITEQRRVQAQIERMAHHDALTALPNRLLFRQRLNEALRREGGQALAVLSIDLDRFKSVNDTLGHPVGDELLRAAARRLNECVRETDVVARLGGDEFAIIQLGAAQPAAAHLLAERLVRVIGAPFEVCGHQVVVGASVGVALVPQDGVDADELLQKSDLALYDAKLNGRGAYSFFRPAMDEQAQSRRALERDLRSAIDKRQLELVYQPIIGLADRRLRSFEALLRWQHPIRGLIMPDRFIALAEETGLIEKIGAWVLRAALAEAARWPAHIGVAVNLSPLQLKSGNLLRDVTAALQASGLAPTRLELEITESVALDDNPFNLAQLRELRAHGVRIALDDFGIGYSSLGYLRSFPFNKIKIDRSFARDVESNRHAAAIVRAMTTLGASLDMPITAEGIETEEQLQAVHALGCAEAQGYLISKPRPVAELAAILLADRGRMRAAARPEVTAGSSA